MMGHPMGEIRVWVQGHNDPSNMSDLRGIGVSLVEGQAPSNCGEAEQEKVSKGWNKDKRT